MVGYFILSYPVQSTNKRQQNSNTLHVHSAQSGKYTVVIDQLTLQGELSSILGIAVLFYSPEEPSCSQQR